MKYTCPACGFPDLDEPPWSETSGPSLEICVSCGIQFGYTDACGGDLEQQRSFYSEWRAEWIRKGMPWTSVGISPPPDWDPATQLRRIGVDVRTGGVE